MTENTEESLIHLAYVSTEARRLTADEQVNMLSAARQKNKQLNITGMLIYRQDSFFQVIEGSRRVIQDLYARIQQDDRHKRIEKLFEQPIEKREFPQWSMNFKELDDDLLNQIPEFADVSPEERESDSLFRNLPRARQLLRAFQAMP